MQTETVNNCNLCSSTDIGYADRKNGIGICRRCGFVFDRERPPLGAIIEYYSKEGKYDDWISKEAERDLLWQRRLRVLLNYRKDGSLLDVGAGIGQFLHFAKKHFDVTGTEVSASAIEIAKKKYGLELLKGTVEDIPFTKRFDMITLYHVLEHVPDPGTTVLACQALLKPRGYLVVAVPNDISGLRARVVRLLSRLKALGFARYGRMGLPRTVLDGSLPEIHLSHFTARVLRAFLESNGFEVVEDTLDQFYAESGWRKVARDLEYRACLWFKKATGINVYLTLLMIARKKDR